MAWYCKTTDVQTATSRVAHAFLPFPRPNRVEHSEDMTPRAKTHAQLETQRDLGKGEAQHHRR